MVSIKHLLRDLRYTEYERMAEIMAAISQAEVPEHLVNAVVYRQGFVDGRRDERRRWEERREEGRRYWAGKQAAEQVEENIEEVTPNE